MECKRCKANMTSDICSECKDLNDLEVNMLINKRKQDKLAKDRIEANKGVLKSYRIK